MIKIDKKDLIIKASFLYYELNKNQSQIAKELGVSRSYVSQLLNYARTNGIVEININVDEFKLRQIKEEFYFKNKFKLKDIYIMGSSSKEFTDGHIGEFAAPYISGYINNSNIVGIGLGTSVMRLIEGLQNIQFLESEDKEIVQIMGGLNTHNRLAGTHSNELVKKLSSILNCKYFYLNCPAVLEDKNIRDKLLQENNIMTTIKKWNELDLIISGIGVADPRSTLFSIFNNKMIKNITESSACGDININFFDDEGKYIPLLEENKVCIDVESYRQVNTKIVVGYGKEKAEIILAALKGGYIDVLITDTTTVKCIKKIEHNSAVML